MKNVATIQKEYGAYELRALYQKYAAKALITAISILVFFIALYYVSQYLLEEEEPVYTVRILKYSDLGPPPSIQSNETQPAVAVSAEAIVKPSFGIPVPVPDAEINPEQPEFATKDEISSEPSPILGDEGNGVSGGQIAIEPEEIKIEEELSEDFVAYEKEPVVVKRVEPVYPEIALKAGIEGTVYVKIWVDKEGKPKKVVLLKSDAEIFNDAAMKAAEKWVFTPAMMNNGPVSVWVTIPFKFKLK